MHTLAFHLASHKHLHQYWMWVVGVMLAIVAIVVVWVIGYTTAQLYPGQRLAPGARMGGIYVGGLTAEGATKSLEEAGLAQQETEFYIDTDTITAPYAEAGVEFDIYESYNRAQNKQQTRKRGMDSAWNFWGLENYDLVVNLDEERFHSFLEDNFEKYEREPVDARIVLDGRQVEVKPEQPSWQIDAKTLRYRLKADAAQLDGSVSVPMRKHYPDITAEQINSVAEEIRQLLDTNLHLTYKKEAYTVSDKKLASWLRVGKDSEGWPKPAIDKEKVAAYLKGLAKDIDEEPVPTEQTIRDGEVVDETSGEKGYELDEKANLKKIKTVLLDGENTEEIALTVNTIEPPLRRNVSYSRSNKGMNALLGDFASSHGGKYGLVMRTLDGDIRASYNGNHRFVAASTYKMYLAFATYAEVERGNLSMNRDIGPGSVGFCVKKMILYSTNPCATALGNTIGWKRVDSLLNEAGFRQTTLNNHQSNRRDKYTTASDAALFMQRLRTRKLMNEYHTQRLLEHMRQQIYRDGTPAGSTGVVANKIGFLQGYLHDVAIIENGGDQYVLAIYSYGGQWWQFSELARQVQNILAR